MREEGKMLRAGKEIQTDLIWNRNVITCGIGMQQRSSLAPIFRGRVRHHYQWIETVTDFATAVSQNSLLFSGQWIGLGTVGKREPIFGKIGILMAAACPSGLSECKVGKCLACSSNINQEPIKNDALLFILIEAIIDMLLEVTSCLRDAQGEHLLDAPFAFAQPQRIGVFSIISRTIAKK